MTSYSSLFRTTHGRALIVLVTLVLASAAREAMGDTFELTVSNVLPSETSPAYATVTLVQKSTNVVEFTITPNQSPLYKTMGATFGVTSFTFDSSLALSPGDFTFVSPSVGCNKVQNPPIVPFGKFNWLVTSTRGANPLVFDVTHTGAVPSSFEVPNANHAEFSTLIVGFTTSTPGVTSQWVSDPGAVTLAPPVLIASVKAEVIVAILGTSALAIVGTAIWFARRTRQKSSVAPAS